MIETNYCLYYILHFNQQMLLLFILLVLDGKPIVALCYTLFHFNQQMLLLFILLVLNGNQIIVYSFCFNFMVLCYQTD